MRPRRRKNASGFLHIGFRDGLAGFGCAMRCHVDFRLSPRKDALPVFKARPFVGLCAIQADFAAMQKRPIVAASQVAPLSALAPVLAAR
jgi:hypothetical protein